MDILFRKVVFYHEKEKNNQEKGQCNDYPRKDACQEEGPGKA